MGTSGSKPPKRCPDCGAVDAYAKRYETGGSWRAVYRCGNCGRRHTPRSDDR